MVAPGGNKLASNKSHLLLQRVALILSWVHIFDSKIFKHFIVCYYVLCLFLSFFFNDLPVFVQTTFNICFGQINVTYFIILLIITDIFSSTLHIILSVWSTLIICLYPTEN